MADIADPEGSKTENLSFPEPAVTVNPLCSVNDSPKTEAQLSDEDAAAIISTECVHEQFSAEKSKGEGHFSEQTDLSRTFIGPQIPTNLPQDISAHTDTRTQIQSVQPSIEATLETAEQSNKRKLEISEDKEIKESSVQRTELQATHVSEPENTGVSDVTETCDVKKQKLSENVTNVVNVKSSAAISEGHTDLNTTQPNVEASSRYDNDFSHNPRFLTGTVREFDLRGNFLKGCKWSPDGSCLATNSDDGQLRLFNLPDSLCQEKTDDLAEMVSVLQMQESELIYDYCWYPGMSSLNPETCSIATTSRDTPIHMWDAFTGKIKCSYRAYDNADDLTAAHSLAFSGDGEKLYSGFNKMIRVFDVNRPGRESQKRPTFVKQGQPGIISCIDMNPTVSHMYAAGSYSRAIALYSDKKGDMLFMVLGQQGGVTQIKFSPDGTKLYSGGRKDPELLCWDVRNPGQILFVLRRRAETNQRMYFDVDSTSRYLISGNHDGTVRVWDTLKPPETSVVGEDPMIDPVLEFKAHSDTVNGISLHPTMPVLATASGKRHFDKPRCAESSDSDSEEELVDAEENSLKLWWVGKPE